MSNRMEISSHKPWQMNNAKTAQVKNHLNLIEQPHEPIMKITKRNGGVGQTTYYFIVIAPSIHSPHPQIFLFLIDDGRCTNLDTSADPRGMIPLFDRVSPLKNAYECTPETPM